MEEIVEQALNRARDAHRAAESRAAADRELLCYVCEGVRKDTGLNCGHILYRHCAENVTACPVCRNPITSRKRVYL